MPRTIAMRSAAGLVLILAIVVFSSRHGIGSVSGRPVAPGTPAAVAKRPLAAAAPAAAAQAVARLPQRNAYFGDLHVHTSWSLDAYALGGNTLDDPTVAYRYGRGEAITRPDGTIRGKLRMPLDFMAVTDHDAWLGEVHLCLDVADSAYNTPTCKDVRGLTGFGQLYGKYGMRNLRPPDICGASGLGPDNKCLERAKHLWHEIQKNADAFNQSGKFTTFPGYEFTAQPAGIGHLHRVVIFRGEKLPEWGGSAVEMQNKPERLWEWLDSACTMPCQVMSIPHNTNWSQGVSMAPNNSDGTPFTEAILKRRAKAEPLVEIFQIKGNSECYLGLGTTDEECNLELYYPMCKPGQTAGCAYASDYVRNALKSGLNIEAQYGVNPFKYGIIASTDDHKSAPGSVDEKGWEGSFLGQMGGKILPFRSGADDNPGGLIGVWADENTRASLFDAMKRKETFGTSGTRIRVRFFGGWAYPTNLHTKRNLIQEAYKNGVPMGSDLPSKPASAKAPRFVVWATKDPTAANLQKIQVIKGWSHGGQTHEQVFDAVCADGLKPDTRTHRCADNGATVDLPACSYSNNKGAAELSTTWTDPEFDPLDRAFYYVRVLENPTCRWTTFNKLAPLSEPAVPVASTIKERAWGSPIWYTPATR